MKKLIMATVGALALLSAAGMTSSAHADDWHGHHNDHDWGQNAYWDRPVNYYYPRAYYVPPREEVIYVQPPHYFSQVDASPTTYTETYYPDGSYTRTYAVGGYLPTDRAWHPIPDYVRFGLATPHRGERWVGNGRDALLITEATSQILNGVLLASAIH